MLTRWHLAGAVVLAGITFLPALGTPEGSPELKRRAVLAIELRKAIAEHELTTQQAVEATTADYLAAGKVPMGDLLLAMDDEIRSALALHGRVANIAAYVGSPSEFNEQIAAARGKLVAACAKHLARCNQLEEQIAQLCQAGQKPDAALKQITAYRQSAEILVMLHPPTAADASHKREARAALAKLLVERAASARAAVDATCESFVAGSGAGISDVLLSLRAQFEAEMAVAGDRVTTPAVFDKHLALCKEIEKQIAARPAAPKSDVATLQMANYRLAAEQSAGVMTAYASPQGSPEREAVNRLRTERARCALRAAAAVGESFAASGDAPLADALIALRALSEAQMEGCPIPHARETCLAAIRHLELAIAARAMAGQRGAEAAKTMLKAFRENAEMTRIDGQLSGPL
jgi:hypothetical protein